jgi:hypothetical protein
MPEPASGPGPHAWGYATSATAANVLVVASTGLLIATLIWPAQLGGGFTGFLIGMLFLAAAIDGLMELVSGFIWGGRARWLRGAVLRSLTLTYTLLPL